MEPLIFIMFLEILIFAIYNNTISCYGYVHVASDYRKYFYISKLKMFFPSYTSGIPVSTISISPYHEAFIIKFIVSTIMSRKSILLIRLQLFGFMCCKQIPYLSGPVRFDRSHLWLYHLSMTADRRVGAINVIVTTISLNIYTLGTQFSRQHYA